MAGLIRDMSHNSGIIQPRNNAIKWKAIGLIASETRPDDAHKQKDGAQQPRASDCRHRIFVAVSGSVASIWS